MFMDMLFQDIRYALRTLVKDRIVCAIVVSCLALGIGVNATLFSVVDGVLIQPLPFASPERLVRLTETFERRGVLRNGVSYPDLRDWKEAATSFETVGAMTARSLGIADSGDPERVLGAAISWEMFPTLGVPPALGRSFAPEDDRPGAEPVVILSDDLWQRRYQGSYPQGHSEVSRARVLVIDAQGLPNRLVGAVTSGRPARGSQTSAPGDYAAASVDGHVRHTADRFVSMRSRRAAAARAVRSPGTASPVP